MIEGRRMTEAFVEERRTALERYLNRLAAHPAAARSEVRKHAYSSVCSYIAACVSDQCINTLTSA
jgi:hypothetical protein